VKPTRILGSSVLKIALHALLISGCNDGALLDDAVPDEEAAASGARECTTTDSCKARYPGATDCRNHEGGVCYCGASRCSAALDTGGSGGSEDPRGARNPSWITYTGRTSWDAGTGTLTFLSTGSFPQSSFFWRAPREVKQVVIAPSVTVTGGIKADHDMTIEGRDRETSVLFGTAEQRWPQNRGIAPWTVSAIEGLSRPTLTIRNLTSRNPRGYNISNWGGVTHVDNVSLIDDRGGDQNNSDGFVGGNGSTIKNSYIRTGDDAIKLYFDMTIEDVTIDMEHNGAPIQFGWNNEQSQVRGTIRGLTVRGVSRDGRYNRGVFSWVQNHVNGARRSVTIEGLDVDVPGGDLFELRPTNGSVDMDITDADIAVRGYGRKNAGTLLICGTTRQASTYRCAD
jgi:hypothetical protein